MAEISRRDWKIVGREKDRFLFLCYGKERLREWLKFQGVDRFVFYCFSLPFVYNSFQLNFIWMLIKLLQWTLKVKIVHTESIKQFAPICFLFSDFSDDSTSSENSLKPKPITMVMAEIASLARVVSRNPGFLVAINQDLSISCCEVR
ncbi:hypothetical protein GQ457_03G025700 [Hibiscus cannabinus]